MLFGTAANRAVEVNEMWRLREKQLELDKKLRGTRSESSSGRGHKDIRESHTSTSRARSEEENSASASLSSKKRSVDHFDPMEDEGLKDDEIDQFLQSRFVCSFTNTIRLFLADFLRHIDILTNCIIFPIIDASEAGVPLDRGWMKLVLTFPLAQILKAYLSGTMR